ncbi:hypothetical protein O1611_g8564 [Lasiodiplodia mahajangana]|uniref:Uncharacterized protein n=1 Tax=Lasiodiplodia mahajangana TaxID=1108764 RepID=A0ACC2JC49_9PEZI|nr:hypothetical protein O1611_g8564 [Lasiodiplodia mahajangana]
MPDPYFSLSRVRSNKRGGFTKIDDAPGGSAAGISQGPIPNPIVEWQPSWWWWWWEIGAVIICIASTAGLVALLKSIDNTPLRQWNLPIQPNSVVASLTTVNKVALLVPAASCISQLKWRHFASAPRKLADLQLFDMASRGPWGSLVFLVKVSSPFKALVTVGFSLLTILALGLDASAQQLLRFPAQEMEVNDGSVAMGAATGYISKSINPDLQIQALNTKVIPLQFAILSSLRGSTLNSYFTCPEKAVRCNWDSLVTLGVCSSWNTAPVASDGCVTAIDYAPGTLGLNATYAVCNYTVSNSHSENPELAAAMYPRQASLTFRVPSVDSISGNKVFESDFIPGPYGDSMTVFGEFWALKGPRSTNFSTLANFKPPEAKAFYASFWWCSRSFQGITVEPSGIKYMATSSERLNFLYPMSNDYIMTFTANSTGLNYTLNAATAEALQEYFRSPLMTTASDTTITFGFNYPLLSIGELLYQEDLENVTNSIADALTNILRSRALDENANITDITGRAVYDETYIRIQWLWLLLPLAETTLVTFLFILSVAITSKHPLLKDSVLANLATTVRDGAQKASNLRVTQWTSQQELNSLAEGITVKLELDEHGQFEFSREKV